jgi:hypothetical protein
VEHDRRSYFHILQARLKEQECRQLLAKCLDSGALTQQRASQVETRINARAAEEMVLAKAIPSVPPPPLAEIVAKGWFSELPRAPFQAQMETIDGLAAKIEDVRKRRDAAKLARQRTARIEGELGALVRERDSLIQAKAAEIQTERQAEGDQIEREAQAEADAIAARIESVLPPITIQTPAVDRDKHRGSCKGPPTR